MTKRLHTPAEIRTYMKKYKDAFCIKGEDHYLFQGYSPKEVAQFKKESHEYWGTSPDLNELAKTVPNMYVKPKKPTTLEMIEIFADVKSSHSTKLHVDLLKQDMRTKYESYIRNKMDMTLINYDLVTKQVSDEALQYLLSQYNVNIIDFYGAVSQKLDL